MLDVEPSNRPTAVQILNHAWMKSSNQPNTHLFTKEKASSDVKVKICQRKQRDKMNIRARTFSVVVKTADFGATDPRSNPLLGGKFGSLFRAI